MSRMFLLPLFGLFCVVSAKINLTEYYKMPKLYALDDVDRCLVESTNQVMHYCYVDVTIRPDPESDTWKTILKYSDLRRYYRHDRLKRGICVEWCERKLNNYDERSRIAYYQELDFDRKFHKRTIPHGEVHKDSVYYQTKYNEIVNQCINYRLEEDYGVRAYSEVIYCNSNQDQHKIDRDILDYIVLILMIFLMFLVACASIYDSFQQPIDSTIEIPLSQKMIMCFSIQRNLIRFKKTLNKSDPPTVLDDLSSITTLRSIFMLIIVMGHNNFLFSNFPLENPEYLEDNYEYDRVLNKVWMNGQVLMQAFFTMTTFLFAYQFYEFREKQKEFKGGYFFKAVIYRYFRVVPTYLFTLLLQATWLVHLAPGPVGRDKYEPERIKCRKMWWNNLIFATNYLYTDWFCVQHGWYLSADFQLFILALSCMMLIWKYPKLSKLIIGCMITISLVVPGIVVYVNRFDPVFIPFLEAKRTFFWFEDTYQQIYIPTHMNLGSSLGGALMGYAYYRIRKENIDMKSKRWFVVCWWLVLPVSLIFLYSSSIFFINDFPKPSVWVALYGSLSKNVWGVFFGTFIIGHASGLGGPIHRFFDSTFFRSLAQVSFCVYLIQYVIFGVFTSTKRPIYGNDELYIMGGISYFALSYTAGIILHFMIEQPCSNLMKTLLDRGSKDRSTAAEKNK